MNVEEIKIKWIRIVVLFFVLGSVFYLVMRECNIKTSYSVLGIVDSGNVVLLIPIEQLQKFLYVDEVMIEGKIYSYKLIEIGEDLITGDDNFFKKIIIAVDLPKKLLRQNNTFSVFLFYEEIGIYRILESCLKE